jgi:UDP-N-acetylmuramoyl-L-alanyl-D-glutamate--2,6-diaminopimelate ligase
MDATARLLVLTGSCGDRMKEKRPVVGKIVSAYADVMVVANEDPYSEDPEKIIDEVWAGIDRAHTKAHRIFDRREAIAFLLKEAKPGDTVLLCGKGSDTTMWVKGGQIPWNEREIVREMLQKAAST